MIFDPNQPIELHCDASSIGFAVILIHIVDKKPRVVAYFSKKATPAQSKYHSYEQETNFDSSRINQAFSFVPTVQSFHGGHRLQVTIGIILKAKLEHTHTSMVELPTGIQLQDSLQTWHTYATR
ncbi:uncharacterized protein LOC113466435 isoform X2 [Diaphorina citri]|uniref:Uncharacterized protein LOC113466435 isoform X1 n=1 Tax=Diaphorina citri TaxID=121845 RepID=A0A3Q0IMV7_DIACI|nr:uncharacterized protein LOC113466435 isoform X1 [Diaphorina citri]XP_026677642.1 uncharacterized protein LOC113466435 isoform X2 [Diaphorina citri]KAI5731527.1 hypothetical protein M8J77_011668 [Diaphorina citri]